MRPAVTSFLIALCAACVADAGDAAFNGRGRQFIGFASFSTFETNMAPGGIETLLTSPEIRSSIKCNEVIVSWNAQAPPGGYLVIEGRALYSHSATKYYTLGIWSSDPARHPRRSVANQDDSDGDVSTDILKLKQPADSLQVRVRLSNGPGPKPILNFLGISLTDTRAPAAEVAPNRGAWGELIPVPERSQMAYPDGKMLCSPTTVSMLLAYWAQTLKRPSLDRPVPEIAKAVYDSQWQRTGNWPFNTAFAGSLPGIRAYVTRFSDISELETWIARKIPVGLSVDYDRLRAKGPGPNGHIVACVGFTKDGDPILNDPGTTVNVRKIFKRKDLADAWACSRNTVYLVYPEGLSTPEDPFGHWYCPKTRH
jgi:hypothetical protein